MVEEKTYELKETLVIKILNYLVTQPYQNVAELINQIQMETQKQQIKIKEVTKK